MTDKPQPDKFDWATELSDAQGHVTLSKQEAKEIGARLRSMGAKLKVYEDLGGAGSDVQLLRMGYAAARLEIESLRKEHADELAVAYMCGASREKELAASQQAVQEPAYPSLPPADEVVHPRTSEPYALWGLMKLMDYAKAYHAANAPQPSPAAQGDAAKQLGWVYCYQGQGPAFSYTPQPPGIPKAHYWQVPVFDIGQARAAQEGK